MVLEEAIVSEYFERNGFMVLPLRKSRLQSRQAKSMEGVDLYARNMRHVKGGRSPSFLLFSSELPYLKSALICVRGWYQQKPALASMRDGAEILRHVETHVSKKVEKWFDFDFKSMPQIDRKPQRVLLAPTFPAQEAYRRQCEESLREKGVHGILSFRSILLDLIERVDTRQVYEKSDTLNLLRLLKTFDLVKDSQMNFLG